MGLFTDLRASATGLDFSAPAAGVQRAVAQDLAGLEARIGDAEYPSGYAAVNEVQSIAIYGGAADGGTVTLVITLVDGTEIETDPFAYDAVAATIEGEIDAAADGIVDGFVEGDIAVTGGPLTTTPLVLTFSGASVAGQNHGLTVLDDTLLENGTGGTVSVSAAGQENRTALAILKIAGILTGAPPVAPATTVTAGTGFIGNPNRLEADTIRALAREAATADDNNALYSAIITAAGLLS